MERQAAVQHLLSGVRRGLDALAETLLTEETLGEAELVRILGSRRAKVVDQ